MLHKGYSLDALLRLQIGATPLKFKPNQLEAGRHEQHAGADAKLWMYFAWPYVLLYINLIKILMMNLIDLKLAESKKLPALYW